MMTYLIPVFLKLIFIPIFSLSPFFMQTSTISFGIDKSVGVVEVKGAITEDMRKTTVKDLAKFRRSRNVKAIVLRIESPGGGVSASQEIFNEVKRIRKAGKPIYASMGSIAASGGYYIAAPCDRIFANPGTATGSIGVIMEIPNVEKLLEKVGVYFMVIKSDEHKDIGSPFREMSDVEEELLKSVIIDVYNQFVDAVVTERRLEREDVLRVADGRILTGRQALEAGLVDELGDVQDAILAAAEAVGIKGKPRVVVPKKKQTLMDIIGIQTLLDEYVLTTIRLQYR
jgi:protease-4